MAAKCDGGVELDATDFLLGLSSVGQNQTPGNREKLDRKPEARQSRTVVSRGRRRSRGAFENEGKGEGGGTDAITGKQTSVIA